MPTVGILGGGQLGLMLAESLDRLGHDVVVLEADPDSPCAQRRSNVISAGPTDPKALAEFFSRVDIATFDSENTPAEPLRPYAAKLAPSLRVLEITQDRAKEKTFLRDAGFRTVQFELVPPGQDVKVAARKFGLPCIAKSVLGGYDGKGQFRLTTDAEVDALPADAPGGWVLEEVLQLEHEVSCLVARDVKTAVSFPLFENLHAHHILDLTMLPARVASALQDEARLIADGIARALGLVGLLTVEFFIGTGRDGVRRLYVNELAPRVHNSGHVTRQACTVSQFDALARILAAQPVAARAMLVTAERRATLLSLQFHKSRLVRLAAIRVYGALAGDDMTRALAALARDDASIQVQEAVKAAHTPPVARSEWRTFYVVDPGADDAAVRQEPYFVLTPADGLVWATYTDARGHLTSEHVPPGPAVVGSASRASEL